ncbi:hypothetical protein HUJ04_011296 [Dendroctonus ponderosae]|nr:hypothetical protein HUJ04_011296 [Dendroctonus ponderosae]
MATNIVMTQEMLQLLAGVMVNVPRNLEPVPALRPEGNFVDCKSRFSGKPLGAAYGTAKSGTGISAMAVMRPELIMRCIIPVVMAGIIAIYGLVVAILIVGNITTPATDALIFDFTEVVGQKNDIVRKAVVKSFSVNDDALWSGVHSFKCVGFLHLGAGLAVGFSGLAAGFAIGIVGDAGVRGTAQQPRLFVGMILILIFAEVLGLYGLIVAIFLYAKN